jgi:hypothetical protein
MSARSREYKCLGDSIPRREKYNITEAFVLASTMEYWNDGIMEGWFFKKIISFFLCNWVIYQ